LQALQAAFGKAVTPLAHDATLDAKPKRNLPKRDLLS